MSINKKLVSVIVVSRNAKNVIRRCLDRILSQTYPNIEVVVVDSSDDGTEKIIEEYRDKSKFPFRIIYQEPKGVGAARNAGLVSAKGDIILGVDVDVFIPVDFIKKIAEPFNDSDKVMGVYTKRIVKSSSNTLFSRLVVLYENIMMSRPPYKFGHIGLGAVRKEVWRMVGGIDTDLEVGEDVVYNKNWKKLKKDLEAKGYLFPVVDTTTVEEKQGQTFSEYWKRCIWYGKSWANMKYLKSDLKMNLIVIIGAAYIIVFPFVILGMLIYGYPVGQIVLASIPVIGLFAYMISRAMAREVITWEIILLPFVVYYKSLWTFVGFVTGLKNKVVS